MRKLQKQKRKKLISVELCAGAGGQAIGLENAGFEHAALVEIDPHACKTLMINRPEWNVIEGDLNHFSGKPYRGIDLLAGGIPCPPFSKAGKQLGEEDERDLFPAVLRLVAEIEPRALMIENVRGLLDPKFKSYRDRITNALKKMDYEVDWQLLQAADFGVPQYRSRTILIALKNKYSPNFSWPSTSTSRHRTVGDALYKQMSSSGWKHASKWKNLANKPAPTLVGGSKKHGGADLGPTRARANWANLGVDGRGVADFPPNKDFVGTPRLTVEMAATVQGFPPSWTFFGGKTSRYKQIGNAFPPPVAEAVGKSLHNSLLRPIGIQTKETELVNLRGFASSGARAA